MIKKNIDEFLQRKRERKNIRRDAVLRARAKQEQDFRGSNKIRTPYRSDVLDLLLGKSRIRQKPTRKNCTLNVPKVFSLIKNPRESLEAILDFVHMEKDKRPGTIHFNHSELESVELSAEAVLDYIADEIRKEIDSRKYDVDIGGAYPNKNSLKRYLQEIGIVHKFKIGHQDALSHRKRGLVFEKSSSAASSHSEHAGDSYNNQVADGFVRYVNKCLGENNLELTEETKRNIGNYTGEVLDNIEQHSGMNKWHIVGYLDRQQDSPNCEIVIFNFGNTIAETFLNLPPNSYAMREGVQPYVDIHERSGFFSSRWGKEELITLAALQDQISCKNRGPNDDRGAGTVQLIEAFQGLHRACVEGHNDDANMAIISGSTHILFDGTFEMKSNEKGRCIIAFNHKNDLKEPPDSAYVKRMDNIFFPGTIVSIQFKIKPEIMEAVS